MTHRTNMLCISFISLSIFLTGCELDSNTSSKANITPVHSEHWFESTESRQKFQKGLTAYLPLYDGFMSMAARLHLINQAKYNLDLQYYIWSDDFIGRLILSELLQAADRGVKVRLMIDDQNGTQLDDHLLALSQHPNIQIKLFNPYKFRKIRALDYGLRLKQVNHRMHNKLIIADGTAAVTGGRNISSEYFEASNDFQFTDVDIFFAGTAVQDANQSFIRFWNDDLSYDIQQILNEKPRPEELTKLRQTFVYENGKTEEIQKRINEAQAEVAEQLEARPVRWAKAHFVADSPNKARPEAKEHDYIYTHMLNVMGEPSNHLELVSAYFVPTQWGADYLSTRSKNGLKVRILTNSFQANDVTVVHAYYQQYREQLLKNGIEIWEFKSFIERRKRTWYEKLTGDVIPAKNKNSSSLHAKFFDVDDMVFIGSFNFDPRSAKLNTEVGLVVESEELQEEITTALNQYLPRIAYQLKLNQQGEIIWIDQQPDGTTITHPHDPETTKFQRFMMNLVTTFPAEWTM
ncbi:MULTISPECIES: phospholipase D family protein [Acinetobacter]|uniref:phospholipase D family protein n=1 Tax=Acinetobacter TaxID=469 RepID=UPI00053851F8|nr:phospholipase D family protein [Acinetobacter sp. HR7]KGT46477.1 hypothetical protein GW12_25340 [Acinetobacter sp. HR7]